MADRVRRVDGTTDTEVRPAEQPATEEPRTGGLALAKVGYDRYVRFVVPYLALLFLVVTVFVAVDAGT